MLAVWKLEVGSNLLEVVSPLRLSGNNSDNISRSTAAVSFSTDKHLDKMGVLESSLKSTTWGHCDPEMSFKCH